MSANKTKIPVVTVIMPAYNVEAYIEKAVDSVLAQSYTNFELLVIDDASPDNSIALVSQKFSDPRLRILKQENRGLAGARNTGIRSAQGEYVAFLDSDDFWHKDKLKEHVELLERMAKPSVTFSASMLVNEQGEPLNRLQTPYIKGGYTARNVFCRNPIGNGSAPVISKSVLDEIAFEGVNKHGQKVSYHQFFDEALKQSEDIDCWTRIAVMTKAEFALIDQPLTFYRVNNAGLSADVQNQYKTWLKFIDKLEIIAPEFILRHGAAAKAFQCRYLARRCLSQAEGRDALSWFIDAVKHSPKALLEEPGRTFVTFSASILFACLPTSGQKKLLRWVL